MSEEKTNVMRLLEQKKVPYTPHQYPHQEGMAVDGATVAAVLGRDPASVFKTLVTPGAPQRQTMSLWCRCWPSWT